jgi:hypothetical protein
MNAEKELLLKLLLEKYLIPETKTENLFTPAKPKKRRTRRPNKKTHKWTTVQKEMLWDLRHQGTSFEKIAIILGHDLSVKQVSSMHANLTKKWKDGNRWDS